MSLQPGRPGPALDGYLQDLALNLMAARSEEGPLLTLFVGGQMLSGQAVCNSARIRAVMDAMGELDENTRATFEADLGEATQSEEDLIALLDRLDAGDELAPDEQARWERLSDPHFLNLVHATYQTPQGLVGQLDPPLAMRVRIDSVDAWFHGAVEPDEG